MFGARDYHEILKLELADRCQTNPQYSLRAFARDLGISPARLSFILSGKRGLSENAAKEIAEKLGLNQLEAEYFSNLVIASDSRSKVKRTLAKEKLTKMRQHQKTSKSVSLEAFRIIRDWYHYAILELTMLNDFKSDLGWIAKRLGISKFEAEQAIERLKKLELLEDKNGHLVQTEPNLTTGFDVPSEALKEFHRQLLKKAQDALVFQTIDERNISSLTLSVSFKDIPYFKKKIKEFQTEINQDAEKRKDGRDEVYCLAVQFFKLSKKI
jgi:uncharacterized protein (TIGR02147 family)